MLLGKIRKDFQRACQIPDHSLIEHDSFGQICVPRKWLFQIYLRILLLYLELFNVHLQVNLSADLAEFADLLTGLELEVTKAAFLLVTIVYDLIFFTVFLGPGHPPYSILNKEATC